MPQVNRDCLSEHDRAVLDSIFNPLQIGGNAQEVYDMKTEELVDPSEEETDEVKESIRLELEAVDLTEKGDVEGALELFERAVTACPQRASVYNNRAQAYRLMKNDGAAFNDLQKALELSSFKGRTGCQALCQRGILYRKQENLESARMDFEMAAKLGSKFARDQLIEINPYAALCNQMLRDAFTKLSEN